MVMIDIFSSFLFVDHLQIDNYKLKEFCVNKIKDNQNISISLQEDILQELIREIEKRFIGIHKQLELSEDFSINLKKCWANNNNPMSSSDSHCHPDYTFSCVYYVDFDQPTDGELILQNPDRQMIHCIRPEMVKSYNRYTSETWSVFPEKSRLIIFPSWLWHFVRKNNSETNRISIVFDAKLERCKITEK